jgi:aspartate racemase
MKTIGLLGGLGPQATIDLEIRLHAVARQLIPQKGNRGYPPMFTYYHRRPPVVENNDGSPVFPIRLDPALAEAARWLGERCDFLLIGSNSVHLLQDEIARAANRPVLSMIEATLQEVKRLGWKKVGALGFIMPDVPVYSRRLQEMGLSVETIDTEQQVGLDAAISAVNEGRMLSHVAREAVKTLRSRGVDGIIPGCTEIPLLLEGEMDAPDLVNPAQLLAEAAIRHALD